MTRYRTIQQVEDSSALAVTGRERLAQLLSMLESLHRRGALSDYNLEVTRQDIAEVTTIIRHLQDELCRFRGKQ